MQDAGEEPVGGKGKQTTITIEPIKGLPVEKDLIVDMEPFFEGRTGPVRRHDQVHPVRLLHDVVPGVWAEGTYFGPAAIVNAHRFIFDSRDDAAENASTS